METKKTAMQIMLSELKLKQVIYEQSGMYESATALVTSIETAKELLAMEKEQIKNAWIAIAKKHPLQIISAEKYYHETYNVKDN